MNNEIASGKIRERFERMYAELEERLVERERVVEVGEERVREYEREVERQANKIK